VEKLGRFFTCQNNLLLQLASGVLKNVSFDKTAREQIEKDLLKVPNFRFVSLVLLYMLSLDDKIRNTFAYSDCMTLVRKNDKLYLVLLSQAFWWLCFIIFKVIKLIAHFPEQLVGKELVSLAINLAAS